MAEPAARCLASPPSSSPLPRRWQPAATVRRRDQLYGKSALGTTAEARQLCGPSALAGPGSSSSLLRAPGDASLLPCSALGREGGREGERGVQVADKARSLEPRASATAAPGVRRGLEPGNQCWGRAERWEPAPDPGPRVGWRLDRSRFVCYAGLSFPATAQSPAAPLQTRPPQTPGGRLEELTRRRRAPALQPALRGESRLQRPRCALRLELVTRGRDPQAARPLPPAWLLPTLAGRVVSRSVRL